MAVMRTAGRSGRKGRRAYRYRENYALNPVCSQSSITGKWRVDQTATELLNLRSNPNSKFHNGLCDLDWYPAWLSHRISSVPPQYLEVISKHFVKSHDGTEQSDARISGFWDVWHGVNKFVTSEAGCVIDEIVEYLALSRRYLVFALLGWQSLLYLPSLDPQPPTDFVIARDLNQSDSGLVFDTYKMPVDLADREMSILLKGYGDLLPARPPELAKVASEISKAACDWSPISIGNINAGILVRILHIRFQWVDTISLHLDFDQATRTLSLFRFPSFCVSTLIAEHSVLSSFASEARHSADPRANREDIFDILREILLSYRLLFGQKKRSRQYFKRQIFDKCPDLFEKGDSLLLMLCSEKTITHPAVPRDRPVYYIERDFPLLGKRIQLISEALKEIKPKSWKELLRDRRDLTAYWTFWLVAIFGTTSIILGIIQALLQGLALHQPNPPA